MSAFRGKNATKGALKVFLDACEQGHISRGSYLIIENLDRLTRDEIIEAIELFLSIIRHGITIVTLTPNREINKENLDFAALVIVIVELSRGHSESFIKSARTRANWDKRRKNVENEAFCKHRPA
jgi:DNA invertase Pin-like site-specific DNA recombinase